MLKTVSILALDDDAAALADAVQRRVSKMHGLDDLVQWRQPQENIDDAIQSMRAQRQRPDSPLRVRDDIGKRELVLVVVSAAGPASAMVLDTVARIRRTYELRRLASFFGIEILCLLPEVTKSDDYAAAYGLLEALSGADPKPFDEVWLLDATNGGRVQFGALSEALDVYADAVAGALTLEPELSGALPGLHPRGMPPAFSSFGYAELFFPRELVLQRVESRFASELVTHTLLNRVDGPVASLQARQFIAQSQLSAPATQSVFKRFQPKTLVSDRTRSADELIAAVRNELQQFRESIHLQNLDALAKQSDHAAGIAAASLGRAVDEALDQFDYPSAIRFLEALLDPLPDVRRDAASPRNLVTELTGATAALDTRLGFAPNMAASDAARKRVRELANLIQDQTLVADAMAPVNAAEQIEELEREQQSLLDGLPEIVFAEESANNSGRNSARESEAARLAVETQAREQELRELFVQRPRAEHALREALEMRRAWIRRQILWAAAGLAVIYVVPHVSGRNWIAATALAVFAIVTVVRYAKEIAPQVRAAREALARIRAQIDATDKAKNAAYNDELQFECDVAHRRATLNVLRRTRDAAKETLDALRTRAQELENVGRVLQPAPISSTGLSIAIIADADVDAWYDRTADDRKPVIREFPITRSASRHLALDDLRTRVAAHAASAFGELRALTLARAASVLAPEGQLAQRMRRFAEISAPLIDLRDDDLPANQAMQRDVTLWTEPDDARWVSQLQRRFPDAQLKGSPDLLRVHLLSRVLHFPAYVLGQIDFYRSHCHDPLTGDLLPTDLLLTGPVRVAYEQVLLGRALGVLEWRDGDSHLAFAEHLASSGAATQRERLRETLAPRLEIARDVERDLRRLLETTQLTPLDRGILGALMKRYALV
jgi:hypothetical protein